MPQVAGETSPQGRKGQKGLKSPPCFPSPPRSSCQTSTNLPSAPKHLQFLACSKKYFLEGAKYTFFFFFFTYPAQRGAMESG